MLEFVLGYTAGQKTASRAASLARDAAVADGTHLTHRMEDLNERIDEVALILRGIWALLEEGGVTAEQLMAKIEEIDLADGVADGKVTRGPVDCPGCDSKIPSDLSKCQYCGTDVVRDEHPLGHL